MQPGWGRIALEEQDQEFEVLALGLALLWRLRLAALLSLCLLFWAVGPGCGRIEREDPGGASRRISAQRRGVELCSLDDVVRVFCQCYLWSRSRQDPQRSPGVDQAGAHPGSPSSASRENWAGTGGQHLVLAGQGRDLAFLYPMLLPLFSLFCSLCLSPPLAAATLEFQDHPEGWALAGSQDGWLYPEAEWATLRADLVPGSVLGCFQISDRIPALNLQGGCYSLHFTEGKTEAHRS